MSVLYLTHIPLSQSALRKSPVYGCWAGEIANIGFHMWRRVTVHKRCVKSDTPPPTFTTPIIHEWEKWLVTYTARRALKRKVMVMGTLTFIKNKFRRWRFYARYQKNQNERIKTAIMHHNRAKLVRARAKRKSVSNWRASEHIELTSDTCHRSVSLPCTHSRLVHTPSLVHSH